MSTVIDTLIYDRTQFDVERFYTLKNKIFAAGGLSGLTAAESAEYMAGMRGAYNPSDMNRVGQAVAYLYQRFQDIPGELDDFREANGLDADPYYEVPYDPDSITVSPKTDWAMGDTPTQSQVTTYLANLEALAAVLPLPEEAPAVPGSLDNLTYTTANDIEYLLYLIDVTTKAMEQERYDRMNGTVMAYQYTGLTYAGLY